MDQDDGSKKKTQETVNEGLLQSETEMISDSDILPPEDADQEDPDDDEEETAVSTRDYHVSGEIDKKVQTKPYGEDQPVGSKPMVMDTGDILVESAGQEESPPAEEEEEMETKNLQTPANPPWEDTEQHQLGPIKQEELGDTLDDDSEDTATGDASPWQQELDDTGREEGDLEETPTFPEHEPNGVVEVSWDEPVQASESDPPDPEPDPEPTQIEKDFKPVADPAQEKTLIFGEGAEPAPRENPFLVVVQGEEEGREIELIKGEMTIGRGADNDLVFPDIACSRRHALLEKQGGDTILTDLGSGNGTLLNSKPVQREVLKDSDEIEIGSTILQFIQPGEKPEPQPESRGHALTSPRTVASGSFTMMIKKLLADPRRRKLIVYGGGGVIGFLFVLILVKAFVGSPTETPASLEEKRRLQEKRARLELDSHLEAAKNLVKEKKWQEAGLRIQLALKIDKTNRFAIDYRNYVTREQRAAGAVQAARRDFGESKWDKAIAELNTISEESEYFDEASRLKKEIEGKYKEELLAQGRSLMKQSKPAQAILKFNEVLKRDPDHKEAALLKRRAEDEQANLAAEVARAQKQSRKRNRPRRKPKRKKPAKARGKVAKVLALYRQGEIDQAIEKAELLGARKQEVALKQFKGVYRRGMQLANNQGQVTKALKSLKQALKMDKAISGGSGTYHEKITDKLGKVYFVKAVDAHTRQKYPTAYQAYCSALKYRPDYARAKQRLRDLEKIAKKLYEEAYIFKSNNPDQAVQKLNVVLKIIPPRHIYYSKAKRLRSQIQGPLSRDQDSESGF